MSNLQGFNADDHGSMTDYSALPEGEYLCIATGSEFKETKARTGEYLEITWEVLSEEYKGRLIWSRLNLKNPNPKAEEIAQRELADICRATGVMRPRDSEELHNKPVLITVVIEENERGKSNRIKKYTSANEEPKEQKTTPNGSKPPWKR